MKENKDIVVSSQNWKEKLYVLASFSVQVSRRKRLQQRRGFNLLRDWPWLTFIMRSYKVFVLWIKK